MTELTQTAKIESVTGYGTFSVQINTQGHTFLNEEEKYEFSKAADKLCRLMMGAAIRENKEEQERATKEKKELLALFGDNKIYVEELPNGYCSDWCCKNRPWFKVTTSIGPIKIGWRKRVINIDWTETENKKHGEELFPDEDVTKSGEYTKDRYIHAWGIEKAQEYINKIMEL